ncbi:MAG: hypothetical protein KDA32_00065 [Phycisphaerales bacterium]|nr:hypothetical protein [Phycisphaerales bacterium]
MSEFAQRTRQQVIDADFLAHRAKLIDIAAFLDRVERAADCSDGAPFADFRARALVSAIAILTDGKSDRARRVLEAFSDHTSRPIDAADEKGACGAWRGAQ